MACRTCNISCGYPARPCIRAVFQSLKAKNIRMSAVFKKIIRDYKLSARLIPVFTLAPELELACARVTEFIGEKFIGEAAPLVKEMLQDALSGFTRAVNTGEPNVAFMQG